MATTSPLPFVLSFIIIYLFAGSCSLRCRWNQFKVEDVIGNLTCLDCFKCPPGEGLTPQCNSLVKYGDHIECKKCEQGKSYSKAHDIGSCKPCGICADHEREIKKCNLTSNSVCGKCNKGFYSEGLTGDCQPCSFCCSFLPNHTETSNSVKGECENMAFYQRCDASAIHCQAPKCRDDQYVVVTNKKGSARCVDCKNCPAGTSPSIPCGSRQILESIDDVKCMKCSLGKTYSGKRGTHPCKPCSAACSVGQIEVIPCNLTHDRVCGNCDEGFYGLNGTECKPCSACCGDENDVQIPECVRQNMPKRTQCSFTQRSITVCQEQSTTRTFIEQKPTITATFLAVIIVGITAIMTMVLLGYLKYRRNRGPLSKFFYTTLHSSLEEVAHGQGLSKALEEPIAHGAQETLSFDKSGVLVQFSDTQSFFSDAQEIRLEICWDVKCMLSPQSGEVQLSPVIKFHPYGKQLSKPVQVKIPHSALVFLSNGWEITLKSSLPHNETIWWKKENQFEVHNNEVSFQVDNLSSYVVTGASLANGKPTKKRLQCAVFGGEGTVGMDYTAYLYVFDDCEASLEKIMQEERSSGRILLGSPQSIYVETVAIETAIKISVKQPVEGWTVGDIKPECITQKHLKDSYQIIPRAEILFKHDNGRNRDFLCIFELTAGDSTTTICAVASIKEDPFRKSREQQPSSSTDRHRLVTGRNSCDPVIINKEKTSLRLENLPKEVFQTVCITLDRPLKGKGNWRHVGASLGFSEEEIQCIRGEMLTSEGSPCMVMLEALLVRKPLFTVAELVQILQARNLNRFDVVEILEPYLYELIPNYSVV